LYKDGVGEVGVNDQELGGQVTERAIWERVTAERDKHLRGRGVGYRGRGALLTSTQVQPRNMLKSTDPAQLHPPTRISYNFTYAPDSHACTGTPNRIRRHGREAQWKSYGLSRKIDRFVTIRLTHVTPAQHLYHTYPPVADLHRYSKDTQRLSPSPMSSVILPSPPTRSSSRRLRSRLRRCGRWLGCCCGRLGCR
jgi:hypothetical protein